MSSDNKNMSTKGKSAEEIRDKVRAYFRKSFGPKPGMKDADSLENGFKSLEKEAEADFTKITKDFNGINR